MTGRRVPAWTVAVPGYAHGEMVMVQGEHPSDLRMVHRLTPVWVKR